jgi:CubicO group peptidase (beta-lactamase class C family)
MQTIDRAIAGVQDVMRRATGEREIPGIVVSAGETERTLFLGHHGHAQTVPTTKPLGLDTVFDLASLTKVVATTTLAMMAYDAGDLDFEDPLQKHLPEFAGRPPGEATVRQLMSHTAGFIWWRAYYKEHSSYEGVLGAIFEEELLTQPGEKRKYSDLSYILLGEIVGRLGGKTLDELAMERIFGPLGMSETRYNPTPDMRARCASTEIDEESGEPIVGVVHDENARAMGGVSGHAGLFSTAYDLTKFARCMLRGGGPLLSDRAYRAMMTKEEDDDGARWMGWVATKEGGFLSDVFGPRSFGHTGFTGTSMWMDPDADAFVIVLTNGVHPKRRKDDAVMNTRIESYRAGLELVRAWQGSSPG